MEKGYYISILICPECGLKFPIPRRRGRKREANHIKDLYCPTCKKVQKFLENITPEKGD